MKTLSARILIGSTKQINKTRRLPHKTRTSGGLELLGILGRGVKQVPSCLETTGCLIQVVRIFHLWFAMSILLSVVFFAANMSHRKGNIHTYHCSRLFLCVISYAAMLHGSSIYTSEVESGKGLKGTRRTDDWKKIAGDWGQFHTYWKDISFDQRK